MNRPIGILLRLLALTVALTAVQGAELSSVRMRIGFTSSCFLGANRNDMEAAFKTFLITVGRQRGYAVNASVEVFESEASLEKAIHDRGLDLAIMDAWQFAGHSHEELMEPVYVPAEKHLVGRIYALLTRRGAGVEKLADLRGKEVTCLETGTMTTGRRWLDKLLPYETSQLEAVRALRAACDQLREAAKP